MAKKLKLFNGRDWFDGHLFVCAHSIKDCAELASAAFRKVKGYEDRPDIMAVGTSEINVYWNKGHWGNSMDGVTPERGVWWLPKHSDSDRQLVQRIL